MEINVYIKVQYAFISILSPSNKDKTFSSKRKIFPIVKYKRYVTERY